MGNGVTLVKVFDESIGLEEIVLRANMNIGMNAGIRSQLISGNQKVYLLLRGKVTKVFKGINTPVGNVSSKCQKDFKRSEKARSRA